MILDTHVLIWFVEGDERLGMRTRGDIEAATAPILISAITPWEIAMLAEKERIALGQNVRSWIADVLTRDGISLAALEPDIAVESTRLPGQIHNDPADRIIIATARHHAVPLLTVDKAILAYGATGHVNVVDARL